jgi:G:T-mismatch repair DNA endonuclease (very short patch repair protein)
VHKQLISEYKEQFGINKLEQQKRESKKEALCIANHELKLVLAKESDLQLLTCKLCGFESVYSIISHITCKHNMSTDEYRSQFPEDILQQISQEQRVQCSERAKLILSDPVVRQKLLDKRSFPSECKHWIRKGFSLEEAKVKVAEFQRTQSLKGNNDKTRALRHAKSAGDNNPMSIKSIAERHGVSLDEAKSLTPCYGRSGEKHPMFGKKHSKDAIRKIGEAVNHSRRSTVEHELTDELVRRYTGEKNSYVIGWCCDYVNHDVKLVVEFFGDFWHHNPNMYSIDWINPFTKRSSTLVWERDARKIQELQDDGYEVVVVWERDWKNDHASILKEIDDAYNRASNH